MSPFLFPSNRKEPLRTQRSWVNSYVKLGCWCNAPRKDPSSKQCAPCTTDAAMSAALARSGPFRLKQSYRPLRRRQPEKAQVAPNAASTSVFGSGTAVSKKAWILPSMVPYPVICPISLIAHPSCKVHPDDGSMRELSSTLFVQDGACWLFGTRFSRS